MSSTPRKVKHNAVLKATHSEQTSKLQHKHQHDLELLEDVRLFAKQRSIIEKEYAQALVKLSQQYLSKGRFPTPPDINGEDGKEQKTITAVWKTVLEETDRVGRQRFTAADTYMTKISDPLKPIKSHKTAIAKKVFEQLSTLQKELNASLNEMMASQKIYAQEQHVTHESAVKADEANAKVKNKSTGLFTSLSKLQKESAKLTSKRDTHEVKSTSSRNEYLLNLSASNAHQIRYYSTDLPNLMQLLDGEMYEKLQEFFMLIGCTELECCGLTQECFTKIMADAGMISRQYNLQCFTHENHVFSDLIQYQYEAQDNDEVDVVSADHQADEQLKLEISKWSSRLAKENRILRECKRELEEHGESEVNGGVTDFRKVHRKKPSESSQEGVGAGSSTDSEAKLETIREKIRVAETAKIKAESRLETLRAGGLEVDSWIQKAEAETVAQEEEELAAKRYSTAMSTKSESSSQSRPESTIEETPGRNNSSSAPNDSTYINYEEEDDFQETFHETNPVSSPDSTLNQHDSFAAAPSSGRQYPVGCVAIYDFQGSNADELSLREGQQLMLIADGSGDGWVQAQASDGTIGFIPENYVDIHDDVSGVVDYNEVIVDAPQETASYETGFTEQVVPTSPPANSIGDQVSGYSSTDYEVQQTMASPVYVTTPPTAEPPSSLPVLWVRALYDYEATSEEELSFSEGQMIQVTKKGDGEVDDGWWEGVIEGRSGVFPSLVVEELDASNPDTQSLTSPLGAGPPAFTPPEPGQFPPQLQFTQPTPVEESPSSTQGYKAALPLHHQNIPPQHFWQQYKYPQESTV